MEMNVDQTIDVKSGEHLLEEQRMCIVGNVEEVCRVCLAVGELEPLADSSVYSTYQLLLHSFNCKSDSELLKNICKHCIKELEGISSFITKFKKSCSILSTIQEYEKGSHPISEDKVNHHETSTEHSNDSDESPKNNIEEIIIDSQDYQDQADFSENEEEESITNAPLPRLTIYPKNQKNKLQPIIHAKSHKIPAYSCSICGQSFLSKKSLDMHSALHTEDDHEVNEIIQLGVDKKTALDKPSDKPYVCNVCGKGVCAIDYCKMCENRTHTLCQYEKGPGTSCFDYHKIDLTDQLKNYIVDIHNDIRNHVASGHELKGRLGSQPPASNMNQLVDSSPNHTKMVPSIILSDESFELYQPSDQSPCFITSEGVIQSDLNSCIESLGDLVTLAQKSMDEIYFSTVIPTTTLSHFLRNITVHIPHQKTEKSSTNSKIIDNNAKVINMRNNIKNIGHDAEVSKKKMSYHESELYRLENLNEGMESYHHQKQHKYEDFNTRHPIKVNDEEVEFPNNVRFKRAMGKWHDGHCRCNRIYRSSFAVHRFQQTLLIFTCFLNMV
ncbi:unnamed protein product [Phaedon cochleariae]|uniref:C2H2-type domain-containing protein n=1 Tax=Phaedon cochleariae TaxID=80249 RepID=A0A9N9X6S9_PHACE|nr:unnamed protein product [Phaedon cochleariae]